LTLLVLGVSANALAQKAPKKAVDFFVALPAEYMTGTRTERLGTKERGGYLMTQSAKPDFLKFLLFEDDVPAIVRGSMTAPESIGHLKLFRAKERTIVGLWFQVGDKNEKNPTTDTVLQYTFLLEYKGGKWSNVTASLMPKVSVDEAYKVLTEDFQMKNVKRDDVRVEAQLNEDKNLLVFVARSKGSDAVTVLKLFKWNGNTFVEQSL
jgi:hypothetical protein